MQKTLVLLDLEDTVMSPWFEGRAPLPANINKIKSFLYNMGGDVEIGLMSWAVHHHEDMEVFQNEIRPWMEASLGITFSEKFLLSVEGWRDLLFKQCGLRLLPEDPFELFRKEEMLSMLMRKGNVFQFTAVVLIDDAVAEFTMQVSRNESALSVKNVNLLPL